jgi:iron(III) transport system substrate-binding protein
MKSMTFALASRWPATLLAGGLLLVLAACGGTASAPAATGAAASSPARPAGSAAAASPSASAAGGRVGKPAGSASGDLQALIDGAKKEGHITYYSSIDPAQQQGIIAAFQQAYGSDIQIDSTRLVSGQMVARYASEATANKVVADVLTAADGNFMLDAAPKGWLAKIDTLPALANWPKQYWTGSAAKLSVAPLNISWNTNLVKDADAPRTWQALLDPKWKGQFLAVDPRNAPILMAWLQLMDQTYGDDYLRGLSRQNIRLVGSTVPGTQEMAAGSASILAPGVHGSIKALQDQGAPVSDATPDLTIGNENWGAVSAAAPHPNGARLLLNFLMSPQGQAAVNKDVSASVLPNIPNTVALPKEYRDADYAAATANQSKLLDLYGVH